MSLHLVIHNVRSVENVGSMLRSADAFGIEKVWMAGYTPTPDVPKARKTALGAERTVLWESRVDVVALLEELRGDGFHLVGLELDPRAVPLNVFAETAPARVAILVGHEREGIPPSLRELCDTLVEIPMRGAKESLNVAVAAAVAMWELSKTS